MSDCHQCAIAAVNAKEAFNRVVKATRDGRRNVLPNGNIDWDSFCGAVEGSLDHALTSNLKRKKR